MWNVNVYILVLSDNELKKVISRLMIVIVRLFANIRCNRIGAGPAAGIAVTEDGYGHISFNDISGMEWGGIDIRNGGHPVVLNNTIHNGHGDGVVIGRNGSGIIFENVIKRKKNGTNPNTPLTLSHFNE